MMKFECLYLSGVWCRGRAAMLMLCLIAMVACSQKDLLDPPVETDVDIVFDWNDCHNAEVEGMTLYFFPDGPLTQRWRFDLSGKEGGRIRIPTGRYKVLAVNNDLRNVEYRNTDSFDLFSACACFLDGDTLTAATGMLLGASLPWVAIEEDKVKCAYTDEGQILPGGERVISLTPDSLCTSYHIRLDSVTGIERVRTVKAIVKGVAESVKVFDRQNSRESCCMVAQLHVDQESPSTILGSACAFGCPDISDPTFQLTIVVQTSHAVYSKSFDITQQVVNSKWQRNVFIVIKGMDIPSSDSPDDSGVGMDVGVDGWQTIEITYS